MKKIKSMRHYFSAGIVTYRSTENGPVYLLLHYTSGHWDFPKGKLEVGETAHQAALRELEEETGLSAIIHEGFSESLSYHFTDYADKHPAHKTVTFFVGETTGESIVLSREHKGYNWLPYHQALEKLTFDNARAVLAKAHAWLSSNSQ